MSEQPPAAGTYDPRPIPPLLLLALPASLGEASALRAMARTVHQTHTALRQSIETSVKAIEKADEKEQDYWWGSLAAYSDSQDFLVRELCDQFGLHDQLDACEPLPGDPVHADTSLYRPRLPASDVEVPEEILEVLYAKRDHLASLAASFNAEANGWKDNDTEDLCLLNRGMSLAYATACDLIEQALARITGLDLAVLTAFLDEHGTTRGSYQ
ncbi:hypothetical protein [Actinocorallia populi]|uniref:hypothetical protein n=1 Tax=Actinocorallia populi TaxID=2079200 RepID=UPI000D095DF3|nr:hypothetical protein [Actinocorallia populi]